MCRFSPTGDPILLEDLVCKPSHSLVKQSLSAVQARTVTNGDGFGIAGTASAPSPASTAGHARLERREPRACAPTCAHAASRPCARHRRRHRAAKLPPLPPRPLHAHPQRPDRRLRQVAPHAGRVSCPTRSSSTDAARRTRSCSLLIVQQLDAGLSAPKAIQHVLGSTLQSHATSRHRRTPQLCRRPHRRHHPLGHPLGQRRPAPAFYTKPQAGGWAIASEPLGDDSEHWTPMAPGQVVG